MPKPASTDGAARGRASIAFLDGHAESPTYPAMTIGRELFTQIGQPHYWRRSGPPDAANIAAFVEELRGPSPW